MKYLKYVFFLILLGAISTIILYFGNFQKVNAEVSEISENTIIFEDDFGNFWTFEDAEIFPEKSQTVILYINDKGTDFLKDDEVVKFKIKEN